MKTRNMTPPRRAWRALSLCWGAGALALLGVPDGQMEAVSFGKEKPAAQGTTEDARAQNRRAELSYR